jgi:hypothetical protein
VVLGGAWDSQSRGASDSIGSAGGGIIGGGPIAPGYPPGGRICDAIGSANGVVIGCIIGGGICEAIGSTNGVVIGGPIGPGGPIDAIGFGVVIGGAIIDIDGGIDDDIGSSGVVGIGPEEGIMGGMDDGAILVPVIIGAIGGAIGAANEVMALGGKAGAIGAEKEAITPVAGVAMAKRTGPLHCIS